MEDYRIKLYDSEEDLEKGNIVESLTVGSIQEAIDYVRNHKNRVVVVFKGTSLCLACVKGKLYKELSNKEKDFVSNSLKGLVKTLVEVSPNTSIVLIFSLDGVISLAFGDNLVVNLNSDLSLKGARTGNIDSKVVYDAFKTFITSLDECSAYIGDISLSGIKGIEEINSSNCMCEVTLEGVDLRYVGGSRNVVKNS